MSNDPTAILISTYRSGSTWASELLYRNGGPDCRDEILAELRRKFVESDATADKRHFQAEILQILENRRENANRSSWGLKMMIRDWQFFSSVFDLDASTLYSLQDFFPTTKIVVVSRSNLLDQALSLHIALQTNMWHQYESPDTEIVKLEELDLQQMLQCYQWVSDESRILRNLISNSQGIVHKVSYEDAVENISNTAIGMLLATMKTHLTSNQIYTQVPLQKSNEIVKRNAKDQLLSALLSQTEFKLDRTFEDAF